MVLDDRGDLSDTPITEAGAQVTDVADSHPRDPGGLTRKDRPGCICRPQGPAPWPMYAAMGRWALEDEAHGRDRLLQLPWTRLLEAMRNRNLVAPLLLEAGVPFEHIYRSWRPAVPLTPASGDSDASSGGPVGGQAGPSDELAVQHAGETPGAERGQSAEQPEGQRPQQELEDRLRRMTRRA